MLARYNEPLYFKQHPLSTKIRQDMSCIGSSSITKTRFCSYKTNVSCNSVRQKSSIQINITTTKETNCQQANEGEPKIIIGTFIKPTAGEVL